jgi:hypothetical protein
MEGNHPDKENSQVESFKNITFSQKVSKILFFNDHFHFRLILIEPFDTEEWDDAEIICPSPLPI